MRLFHWRADEAKPLIAALRAGGYTVDYPGDKANGNWRSLRESPPLAAVIDLTRLPSHGRYVAAEIRATKSIRHIPIVFVDGDPEKVERIRKDLPDAVYTSRSRLVSALKRVKPLADPVVAPRMMDRTDRTTAEKLGIKAGARVALIDPPADYVARAGQASEGCFARRRSGRKSADLPLTLWFVRDPDTYLAGLGRACADALLPAGSGLFIRKGRQASGLTQGLIREAALSVGLVDYKVCSVNEVWTGLLFTRKKK